MSSAGPVLPVSKSCGISCGSSSSSPSLSDVADSTPVIGVEPATSTCTHLHTACSSTFGNTPCRKITHTCSFLLTFKVSNRNASNPHIRWWCVLFRNASVTCLAGWRKHKNVEHCAPTVRGRGCGMKILQQNGAPAWSFYD